MVIEVVIFFIWVLFVVIVGAVVTIRSKRRRKMQGIENINARLSFPQRNWLPICVAVAIVSPLMVNAVKSVTRKNRRLFRSGRMALTIPEVTPR